MFRSLLLSGVLLVCALASSSSVADPSPPFQLPDSTPPGKPHFDSKGAKVGDELPNLPMHSLDGKPTSLRQAWADATTLLLTSSYTCPKSRASYHSAAELAKKIAGRGVRVAIIYVIEAHPAGDPSPYSATEEVTSENRRDHILCRQPKTLDERLKLAGEFAGRLKIEIPIFVDAMDNSAWAMLGGGPNMGVLVDKDGIILARQGWFDSRSMETAINALVASSPKAPGGAEPDEAMHQLHSTFYQLIAGNKADEIKALLDQQPQLQQRFLLSGESLLQEAASFGTIDIVKLLVARGADVHFQNRYYATPLHLAAGRGQLSVVEFLIEHGADVNSKAQGHGPTPLQEALLSDNPNPDVVAALLNAGAKANFYTAAATGDLAELQRDFLADMTIISRPDGSGRNALVYAAKTDRIDSAKLLVSLGARDYANDAYGHGAVLYALRKQNLEMTRLLLDAGGNPNLFYPAIEYELPADFVRALLDHKGDPNSQERLHPLHTAAGHNRQDIMQMLLDAGADINSTATESNGLMCGLYFYKGDTALHIAIENMQPSAAEFLAKHGARVDVKTESGETALHLAVSRIGSDDDNDKAEQIVKMLLEHHADVNARDKDGRTPLDYATSTRVNGVFEKDENPSAKFVSMIELLRKHGAVNGKPSEAKTEK